MNKKRRIKDKVIHEAAKVFAKDLLRNNGKMTMKILAKAFAVVLQIKNANKGTLECDMKFAGKHFGHFKIEMKRTKKPWKGENEK